MSMSSYRCSLPCITALAFIALLLPGPPVLAQQQARSFAITHWNGDCGGSTRVWWDDMCMAWRKEMGARGWQQWWANFQHVRAWRFGDPSRVPWGQDNGGGGADRGHAALVCTHGGHNDTDGWVGSMHTRQDGTCAIRATQMNLGGASGGRLRFWHMSSCNSVRWNQRDRWWNAAAGRVHVVTGFHGLMYIGSKYVEEYRQVARRGHLNTGVGRAWVDQMHHVDHWYNAWKTVCPIALGFGNTQAASSNALNERYGSQWQDRAPNWRTTRYVAGCDPDDGPKLP